MRFVDDITDGLIEFRELAESLMVDTVKVERPASQSAPDSTTLKVTTTYTQVYSGKARVQRWDGAGAGGEPVVGEREFGLDSFFTQLPVTAAAKGIKPGDRVTVTAATFDPDLVGVVGTVRANKAKTHATKRVLLCEEVTHGND